MMAELLMVIVILASGTLLGFSFSQNLVNRRKTLEAIIESLEKMKTYIGFSSMEIFSITAEVFGFLQGFEEFTRVPESDVSYIKWWEACVKNLSKETGLCKEDKELLLRFSQGVGVSDVEGQMSHLDLFVRMFNERLHNAREAENKKSRLYKILGFSLGCAVTLTIV